MSHLENIATRQRKSRVRDALFAMFVAFAAITAVTTVSQGPRNPQWMEMVAAAALAIIMGTTNGETRREPRSRLIWT